ncbi:MAG: hypothetical protein HUJ30_02355 [Gammaproteobacteria bacterium]|nr:hypothetical protein [Gammaproteobacteria bacterium]
MSNNLPLGSKAEREAMHAQMLERGVVDAEGFERFLADEWGWAWQKLARGEYDCSVEEAQLYYICTDPVLWCRTFLNEPDPSEEMIREYGEQVPYQFWPYQEESVRAWYQNVVHQDGAEVGKTREITAIAIWGAITGFGFTVRNPTVLIGAPKQTHLDDIIMAIESHVGETEGSTGPKPIINRYWVKPKKHPHYMMKFKGMTCGKNQLALIHYRPAGHDGEAFRGVHVNAAMMMDEAAKIKHKVIWSEFWRAGKPDCIKRVYSVPDGDNSSEYFMYTKQAIPNLQVGKPGWRLFHWPKTIMPYPFWSKERDAEFTKLFKGKDQPGYQRNVLGLHGQQENPVWPWEDLEANIRDVQEYRCIKLTVDKAKEDLNIVVTGIKLHFNEGKKHAEEYIVDERVEDMSDFIDTKKTKDRRDLVRRLLKLYLEPMPNRRLWAGADLGLQEPTEILVSRDMGSDLRDVIRIHATRVPYWLQCQLIYCLDELLGFQPEWGVDFGNAGTKVVTDMQNEEQYEDGNYEDRMTGISFANVVDCIDEEGNELTEKDKDGEEKGVRLPLKELATNLITDRFQERSWAMPYDVEVIDHHANHTAKEGKKHRIFDKHNDHTIDARRVLILRKAFSSEYGGSVFSSGVNERAA